uniref:Uncharacterized protein MANES_06G153500 n=1 Tax=Rhizophora mucronata TaxID=61149 RepID=A0A2P2KRK2_RHIMU
MGGDSHETCPRKIAHTENLTNESGATCLAVGIESCNPDRRWEAIIGLSRQARGGGRFRGERVRLSRLERGAAELVDRISRVGELERDANFGRKGRR